MKVGLNIYKHICMCLFMSLMLLFVQSANAISLDNAKSQGYVGESPNGYLDVVSSSSYEVDMLVEDVNVRRKTAYKSISNKRGVPITDVEVMAGEEAISKTQSGQFIKVKGKWVRK